MVIDKRGFFNKFSRQNNNPPIRQPIKQNNQENNPTIRQSTNQNNSHKEIRKPDVEKHTDTRKVIMNYITRIGPCLPIKIAKETGLNTLFAGAFLSELVSEKILKMSNMRVGSSPVYYAPGQENRLIEFTHNLKGKEKEAYNLIMNKGLLRDDLQHPAIRVAIRGLKDFAFPLTVKYKEKAYTYWRYLLMNEEEAKERITRLLKGGKQEIKKETIKTESKQEIKKEKKPEIKQEKKEIKKEIKEIIKEKPLLELKNKKKNKKEKKPKENLFLEIINEYLKSWDIEVLEQKETKKRDIQIRIRINSDLGKIEYLAVCKNKKRISDTDLTLALQKAKSNKMPCLFITNGKLSKKAENYVETWKNTLKIRIINIK